MKTARLIVTLAAIGAAGALAPAPASASVYCVGSPGGTCDTTKPATAAGLQEALTAAEQSDAADLVRIGPGTFAGDFHYFGTSEVDVRGSGASTIIQGAGSQPAISLTGTGSGSLLSDVEIHMANVPNAAGLRIGPGTAERVRVENPHDSYGAAVKLQPGGKLVDSTILAAAAIGVDDGNGAGPHEVRDTSIRSDVGVQATSGTWNLDRLQIVAKFIGVASSTTTNLRNSLVRVTGKHGDPGVTYGLYQSGAGVLAADHVTINGPFLTYGATAVMTSPGTATISMKNSIVAGTFAHSSFAREALGGGTASIVVGHSDFTPPSQSWVDASKGPGAFQQSPNGTNVDVDPMFVDPTVTLASPTVDFRLRHDSPLIDGGEPGGAQGVDLASEIRVVDGDGAGVAVRDIGAYEYQRRPPTAVIASPTGGAFAAGAPVTFSAQGSSDPDAGDPLSYDWSFGDGAGGSGATASHAYDAGGQRTVTLTVTDPTGLTATATTELLIEGPPTPPDPGPGTEPDPGPGTEPDPGPGTEPGDALAPTLSRVSLSAPVFRVHQRAAGASRAPRGTHVRFTLSEPADVRFSIERRSLGRRVGGACRRTDRRNRSRPGCVRWVAVGSFARQASAGAGAVPFAGRLRLRGRTRSLAPGRHRLTLVAIDAAGNVSAGRRLPFRIVR